MISRTPRHFDGTKPPGVKIEEILPTLLTEIEQRNGGQVDLVFQEWRLLLGAKMAPLARPISFVEGILTVIVQSSTFYSLLKRHEKVRLQQKLQEKFQVKDIVFKIG